MLSSGVLRAMSLGVALLLCACDRSGAAGEKESQGSQPSRLKLDRADVTQWRLPSALREISGLALTDDGRLLAHDDERAVIHEIDYTNGRITKSFAFGDESARDDFEGIAIFDGRIALSTSRGELYLGVEGGPGERVASEYRDLGLGSECEFEGLAFEPTTRSLLLPCKNVKSSAAGIGLKIVVWSIDRQARRPDLDVIISERDLKQTTGSSRYQASGIEVDPRTGNRILTSARQPFLLELDAAGQVLAAPALPKSSRHKQTEGIALGRDGTVFLADEGGRGRALLSIYRAMP